MTTHLFRSTVMALFAIGTAFTAVQAQNSNTISLGVKGGIQGASFSEFALGGKQVAGFNAGLTSIFSTMENWAIGADLNFSRMGGEYFVAVANGGGGEIIMRRRTHADYARLTPKAYYFFGELGNKFRPKLMAGPSLGILTDASAVSSRNTYTSELKSADFGIAVGAGVNYTIVESIWLTLDAEYYLGLTNVNKISIYEPARIKNNALALNLGLCFGLSWFEKK